MDRVEMTIAGRVFWCWALTLAIGACVAGFPTTTRGQTVSGPAPVAEAPAFTVGDEWQWSSGRSRRVIKVDGDFHTVTNSSRDCGGCLATRDRNLTITRLVDANGKDVVDFVSGNGGVGSQMLDFPMTIGTRWAFKAMQVSTNDGGAWPFEHTFTVDAIEAVTTKAGAFQAFRIVHFQRLATSPTWLPLRETLWYAPTVKAFVKRESHTGKWGSDWELVSYSLMK